MNGDERRMILAANVTIILKYECGMPTKRVWGTIFKLRINGEFIYGL